MNLATVAFHLSVLLIPAFNAETYQLTTLQPLNNTSMKPNKLSVLGLLNGFYDLVASPLWPMTTLYGKQFIPFDTAWRPSLGMSRRCAALLVQSIFDQVNTRTDILPDYQLQFQYLDSDLADLFLPQLISDFVGFHEAAVQPAPIRAPIILGPVFSPCPTIYSKIPYLLIQSVINHYKLGMLYGSLCNRTGGLFAGEYINFESPYNVRAQHGDITYHLSMIRFIKDHWKRVGVFCDLTIPGSTIETVIKLIDANGVAVVHTEVGNNYVAMFEGLKQKRARIILVSKIYTDCSDCHNMWCSSYKAGIVAPKYAILLLGASCRVCIIAASSLGLTSKSFADSRPYVNCPLEIRLQQLQMAFFSEEFGEISNNLDKRRKFNDGKRGAWLGIVDEAMLKVTLQSNGCSVKEADVFSNPLATNVVSAIMVLNRTENELRNRFNMSLRKDINDIVRIGKVVAQQADALELPMTISYDNYNDSYRNAIFQVGLRFEGNDVFFSRTIPVIITPFDGKVLIHNVTRFVVEYIKTPLWQTRNGKAPSDLNEIIQQNGSNNWLVSTIVTATSSGATLFQLVFIVYSFAAKMKRKRTVYDKRNNAIVMAGCITLNFAATILVLGSQFFSTELCLFRQLLVVIGLSVIVSSTFVRSISLAKFVQDHRYISSGFRKKVNFNLGEFELKRTHDVKLHRSASSKRTLYLTFLLAIPLALWLATDRSRLKVTIEFEDDPLFDEAIDAYYNVRVESCDSASSIYWTVSFAAILSVLIAVSVIFPSTLKHKIKFVRKRFLPEVSLAKALAANSASVFIFAAFFMIVIPSKLPQLAYLPTTAFSSCLLLLSISTCLIIVFSYISENRK